MEPVLWVLFQIQFEVVYQHTDRMAVSSLLFKRNTFDVKAFCEETNIDKCTQTVNLLSMRPPHTSHHLNNACANAIQTNTLFWICEKFSAKHFFVLFAFWLSCWSPSVFTRHISDPAQRLTRYRENKQKKLLFCTANVEPNRQWHSNSLEMSLIRADIGVRGRLFSMTPQRRRQKADQSNGGKNVFVEFVHEGYVMRNLDRNFKLDSKPRIV